MDNIVKIFKEKVIHLAPYAGKGKIFEHLLCTGERKSYDTARINRFFAEGDNPENLFARLIIMMEYLQAGYHSHQYSGPAGEYEHTQTEYPEKYRLLVHGLSDEAIAVVRTVNVALFTISEPSDLAQRFCDQLLKDRITLEVTNDNDASNSNSLSHLALPALVAR